MTESEFQSVSVEDSQHAYPKRVRGAWGVGCGRVQELQASLGCWKLLDFSSWIPEEGFGPHHAIVALLAEELASSLEKQDLETKKEGLFSKHCRRGACFVGWKDLVDTSRSRAERVDRRGNRWPTSFSETAEWVGRCGRR